MHDQLSPRQIARAIRVSESSVKRWCDQGTIQAIRTAGGHRRIPLASAVTFLRRGNYEIFEPQLLGLPAGTGQTSRTTEQAQEQFQKALLAGDEECCRRVVLDLFLARHRVSTICDRVIARSFHLVGESWACGETDVYQERRGCEISSSVLHELRSSLPEPPPGSPLAIGCTPEGDRYALPTKMIELVLREVGWRATSLGTSIPFESMQRAVQSDRPRIFWLSVSHIEDEQRFVEGYHQLTRVAEGFASLVVGGRALSEPIRQQLEFTTHCESLERLDRFAGDLLRQLQAA